MPRRTTSTDRMWSTPYVAGLSGLVTYEVTHQQRLQDQNQQFGKGAVAWYIGVFPKVLFEEFQDHTNNYGEATQDHKSFWEGNPWSQVILGRKSRITSHSGGQSRITSHFGRKSRITSHFGRKSRITSHFGRKSRITSHSGGQSRITSHFGRKSRITSHFGRKSRITSHFGRKSRITNLRGQARIMSFWGDKPRLYVIPGGHTKIMSLWVDNPRYKSFWGQSNFTGHYGETSHHKSS